MRVCVNRIWYKIAHKVWYAIKYNQTILLEYSPFYPTSSRPE